MTRAVQAPTPLGHVPSSHGAPFVSVIVPCRNEAGYIAACLDSILATTYPADRLEVLVADGRSDDGTRAIVARYAGRHPAVRLIDNPRRTAPAALNLGIEAAAGEIIARMDAHVTYPPDYLPKLVAALCRTGADNVGGRIDTRPVDHTPRARGIALALAHPLGVGNSYFRIGVKAPRWVDTVPFGCYRRSAFERFGRFDEDLIRNQDDEFNHRLIRRGGRVLLLPDVVACYYPRASRRQVARMYYQYGYFKLLSARKLGRIMTVRQLIPPLFVLALVVGLALAPWAALIAALWSIMIMAYVAAIAGCATSVARHHGARVALVFAGVLPILHLSYGFGFVHAAWNAFVTRRSANLAAAPSSR